MKSWKAAVRTWEINQKEQENARANSYNQNKNTYVKTEKNIEKEPARNK